MPERVDEIITPEEQKQEMRIPAAITDHDGRVERAFAQAVDIATKTTGIPILDRSERLWVSRPSDHYAALVMPIPYIREVERFQYWTVDGELRSEPDGTIVLAMLGRTQMERPADKAYLWPPVDGWPAVLGETCFIITVKEGIEILPEGVKTGIILLAREIFDGHREINPGHSAFRYFLSAYESRRFG